MKKLECTKTVVLVLAAACCVSTNAQAQVRYFEHVPTVEEVQAAFAGASSSASEPTVRRKTRGVEWNVAMRQTAGDAAQVGKTISQEPTRKVDDAKPTASLTAVALPVNFSFDSAQVTAASMGYIEVMALTMQRQPNLRLQVQGHTDAVGSAAYNMRLSWDRALAVYRLLVTRYGIDPARLQPVGLGPMDPLPDVTPGDSKNRRVQFTQLG